MRSGANILTNDSRQGPGPYDVNDRSDRGTDPDRVPEEKPPEAWEEVDADDSKENRADLEEGEDPFES